MSTLLHMPTSGGVPKAKRPVVAIIVPCVDKPHMLFTRSLAVLFYDCAAHDIPLALVCQSGSSISKTRNLAMAYVQDEVEAKGTPVEWTLWLDSDMVFPQYLLRALLSRGKDIVGCTYLRRSFPYEPLGKTLENIPREVKAEDTLIEMAGLPTGVLLVKNSVYKTLKRPYFRIPYREESDLDAKDEMEWGEDYAFCAAARAAGHSIWLDVHLSKLVGHIAERPIYPDQPVFAPVAIDGQ